MDNDRDAFRDYLDALDSAGNEEQKRQAFVAFAASEFSDGSLVKELTLGAEYKVNFTRSGLIRRGSADALFGNVVMEFERELDHTKAHALDQLRNYVAGAWAEDGHNRRPYLAIATDGSDWEAYSTTPMEPGDDLSSENVELELLDSFTYGDLEQSTEFRNFLNRLFYRDFHLKPSAENIVRDFGPKSLALRATVAVLERKASELEGDIQFQTLKKQWEESLRIAYGTDHSSEELFILHTYLATLARLLVWAAIERRVPQERDVDGVLSGDYFIARKIANLWEDDFFKWPSIGGPTDVRPTWVGLARQFATYDMTSIDEDILKPLYEDLVDAEVRHGLGEYYTPDWLADRVTERTLAGWDWDQGLPKVLDPTCGSGTFLRATVSTLRRAKPDSDLESILEAVVGFDVHPLAVIVSRATYTLAVMDLVEAASSLVTIPVYIADSFSLPEISRQEDLFGEDLLPVQVGEVCFNLPAEFVLQADVFDRSIAAAVSVAKAYGAIEAADDDDIRASLLAKMGDTLSDLESADAVRTELSRLTLHLTELVRRREDSFFGFVIRNAQRPSIMRHDFDFVVGNPPWLTIGDVETSEYRERLAAFCAEIDIASRRMGEQAHTDLGTLFLAHVTKTFLRENESLKNCVRVGFVLTRSVFAASHHGNLREGKYASNLRMDIEEIWDLAEVAPLFRVPSCVLFASKTGARPDRVKTGVVFAASLSKKEASAAEVERVLQERGTQFELAFLAERSAWRESDPEHPLLPTQREPHASPNAYVDRFRQGAILYPQTLLVVRPEGSLKNRAMPIRVRTDRAATRYAKKLRNVEVDSLVDGENLFMTAAAEHILPYALATPLWMVILPTVVGPESTQFKPVDPDDLRRHGRLHTADWLEWAEGHWKKARKEGETSPLYKRIDTYGQLSSQAGRQRYVVLYNSSGGRPVSCMFDAASLPLPFVARDKTYWCAFGDPKEAAFLTAFLNSEFLATSIVDWMTTGLFGARDIHKRALDVPWPNYKAGNSSHRKLAEIALNLSDEAAHHADGLTSDDVGHLRSEIRDALPPGERDEVEHLVMEIAASV